MVSIQSPNAPGVQRHHHPLQISAIGLVWHQRLFSCYFIWWHWSIIQVGSSQGPCRNPSWRLQDLAFGSHADWQEKMLFVLDRERSWKLLKPFNLLANHLHTQLPVLLGPSAI